MSQSLADDARPGGGIAVETDYRWTYPAGRANQQVHDALAELGELAKTPEANIIKLPNISASMPAAQGGHRRAAGQGLRIPDYPEEPENDEEKRHQGHATTRSRAPRSTRCCARATPTGAPPRSRPTPAATPTSMGKWSSRLKSPTWPPWGGDFRSNEQSVTSTDTDGPHRAPWTPAAPSPCSRTASPASGRRGHRLHLHERRSAPRAFLAEQVADAKSRACSSRCT